MCECQYCLKTGPVKENCCYACQIVITGIAERTAPKRKLHTVNIDIEYFDDESEHVQSLLWELMQACESFSHSADTRMVR